MNGMEKMSRWLGRFEEVSLIIMVTVTLSLVVINVLLRFGFNFILTWAEELSRYLFIVITYVGASAGVRAKGHIVVDLVITQFPGTRKLLFIVGNSLATLFCLILFFSSAKAAYFLKNIGQTSTGLSIPMWIPYMGVIFGSLMMLFRFNEVFLKAIRGEES
jgi:C4-dicarboxylate transporter, DctQ subunit